MVDHILEFAKRLGGSLIGRRLNAATRSLRCNAVRTFEPDTPAHASDRIYKKAYAGHCKNAKRASG